MACSAPPSSATRRSDLEVDAQGRDYLISSGHGLSLIMNTERKTKKIIIIGGGAAGLASLQAVLESSEHRRGEWEVLLFEEREDTGGIWYVLSD